MYNEGEEIGYFSNELENLIEEMIGSNWRSLSESDVSGALGIAIMFVVLNGCPPNLGSISYELGTDRRRLHRPYMALSQNGAFQTYRISKNRKDLKKRDPHAWLYYAGYASELIGNVAI